jgi:hypothetical protein
VDLITHRVWISFSQSYNSGNNFLSKQFSSGCKRYMKTLVINLDWLISLFGGHHLSFTTAGIRGIPQILLG